MKLMVLLYLIIRKLVKMKIKEISGFLFISILLCLGALGCKDEANKFEGKWYNKSNPESIITIYRSGNNFIY